MKVTANEMIQMTYYKRFNNSCHAFLAIEKSER